MFPFPYRRIPPLGPPKASPRQRVLAAWRGADLNGDEIARVDAFRRTDKLVVKLAGDLRLEHRRAETEIVRAWNGLLDPNLTAHAQPTGLRRGTLFVTVDSSVWLSEIVRYRRREILERLQHTFGRETVRKISFRLG